MAWCKKYLDKNYGLNGHAKYSLRQVAKAINKIVSGSQATFHKSPSKETLQRVLRRGDMVLFEEKNPIHTAVLLYDGKKIKRFSDGHYNNVTIAQELAKRCGDSYYGGCVFVKKIRN